MLTDALHLDECAQRARVHFLRWRSENHGHSQLLALRYVLLKRLGILLVIFFLVELNWIHENADYDVIRLFESAPDQPRVPRVERAHRGNQANGLFGAAYLCKGLAQRWNRAENTRAHLTSGGSRKRSRGPRDRSLPAPPTQKTSPPPPPSLPTARIAWQKEESRRRTTRARRD